MKSSSRTLEDIRRTLETISNECITEMELSSNHETELLRDVVQAAQQARERVLDVSIAVSRYITHCLEQEDRERGLPT